MIYLPPLSNKLKLVSQVYFTLIVTGWSKKTRYVANCSIGVRKCVRYIENQAILSSWNLDPLSHPKKAMESHFKLENLSRKGQNWFHPSPFKAVTWVKFFFLYIFFGGLECVSHFFAYVAPFVTNSLFKTLWGGGGGRAVHYRKHTITLRPDQNQIPDRVKNQYFYVKDSFSFVVYNDAE